MSTQLLTNESFQPFGLFCLVFDKHHMDLNIVLNPVVV